MTHAEFIYEATQTSDLAMILADEAEELARSAEKIALVIQEPQLYPQTISETYEELVRNYTDVSVIIEAMKLQIDENRKTEKLEAWAKRIGYQD